MGVMGESTVTFPPVRLFSATISYAMTLTATSESGAAVTVLMYHAILAVSPTLISAAVTAADVTHITAIKTPRMTDVSLLINDFFI